MTQAVDSILRGQLHFAVEDSAELQFFPVISSEIFDQKMQVTLKGHEVATHAWHSGTAVRLQVWGPRGIVSASTRIIENKDRGHVQVALEVPENIDTLQRRAFFRMPVSVPVRVRVDNAAESALISKRYHHYNTLDVSGGGFSVETELELVPGDKVHVKFWPDSRDEIPAEAVVAWNTHNRDTGFHSVGFRFTEISEPYQDRLMKEVFDAELEEARRQLLDEDAV